MSSQENAICRAIEAIEHNLDRSIMIEEIANNVGYSKAHFQRVFLHYTGQTMNRYLFQRKISEAAKRLVESDDRIIDISLEFGFASHEAFSRAFKKYFTCTPFQFRKNRSLSSVKLKKKISEDIIMKRTANKVEYIGNEIVPEFQVFGFSCESMLVQDIYNVWNRLNKNTYMKSPKKYGVLEYEDNTSEVEFEYIAGVNEVIEDFDKKVIIKENQYAVFRHIGSYQEISAAYRYIYGKWANDTRLSIKYKYDFEKYKENEKGVLLYVPVS